MSSFSRRVARLDAVRSAASLLTACIVLALGAYAFSAYYTNPTPGALAAALAALAIAGSGLLYAWRPGTGGLGD
ncbi:MAG TPA: hypothetical protein VKT20_09730 [Candidatus Dormibacteraeota bacterium]|jgi:hypothetical protein|nr:hypothetical protein [Candidatus Dormibacteraeota bacterium]